MMRIWMALSVIVFVYILQLLLGPKNRKRAPPGPRAIPILGHFHLIGKNPHSDLFHLARKHGPIMGLRFGFVPTLIVSSPSAAELVLKSHDRVFASRPSSKAAIYINQMGLASGPYGPYWRNMRKLYTLHLLSSLKIAQLEPMRRAELKLMVSALERAAEDRETVDLSSTFSLLTGDMNSLMLFGRRFSDSKQKGLKDVMEETMELAGQLNLADYFPYVGVLDLQGLHGRMKRVSKIFNEIMEKIIDDHLDRKQETKQAGDIIDTLMEIMESGQAGFDFDRRHVKAVLVDLMVAGMDTTPIAIEWAMSELIRHPTVMKKLQQELESVVGLDKMVEESHLSKLKYLDCVVKESMRLHPVAPLLIPHESVEDCELEGYFIPKNSRILVNVWAIGRDPNVWPNPELFAPERFIGSDIDLRGRHFELLPFGSGRRGCPGLQLGLTLVKLVVAQFVHCFDWKLPDGMEAADVDMSEHFGLATCRAIHLRAIPVCRLRK